jgi:hypothetical protein
MNVMVQISREITGQIIGHTIEIFKRIKKRGRFFIDGFDAHDGAGLPRYIRRKFDHPLFDNGSDAHGKTLGGKIVYVNSRGQYNFHFNCAVGAGSISSNAWFSPPIPQQNV